VSVFFLVAGFASLLCGIGAGRARTLRAGPAL
jgi:hypothetical protein